MPRAAPHPAAKRRSAADLDWAFRADDAAVLGALADGTHAAALHEFFGARAYADLSLLAAAADKARRRSGGPRVLILPGIMGSKLGAPELIWIDPLRIGAGRLSDLKYTAGKPLQPQGVLLFTYAKLKLSLQIDGCDVSFFAYDWRRGIDELGSELAARIAAEGEPVNLVAHSMGGLVARVAMRELPRRLVRKLIMLGTPNRGSFAPAQALRGTYPFVRKLASFDRMHSPEYLAEHVFRSFPGIHHLLPPRRGRSLDLLDLACWPDAGVRPDAQLLARVPAVRRKMAAPDSRMTHIVGINQETVVEVRRAAAGFEYVSDANGDGTVPVALARLPKLKCYFVDEVHGNLANNREVISAVIDVLRRGGTRRLARRFVAKPGRSKRTDDARLASIGGGKIDWRRLDAAHREAALAQLDAGRLGLYQLL